MNAPLPLPACLTLTLTPRSPFNFDASLHKPDHFSAADNAWQAGVRWQTMLWQGLPLGLKFANRGSLARPEISLSIFSELPLSSDYAAGLQAEIAYRYNFDMDLAPFNARFSRDPGLGPVIQRWNGMRPLNYSSLYEYLIITVMLQNATARRSVNMLRALFEHYGRPLRFDGKELYCFWSPAEMAAVSEAELRSLKVGYRAKTILRLTQAFAGRAVDEFELRSRSRPEQRRALLALFGVGPASVGYGMTDVFHQVDEMEHISPWEQKIYSRLFFDTPTYQPVPVPQLLDYFNQRFAGWRVLAVHYFWEDLFWQRKNQPVPWLEELIRL